MTACELVLVRHGETPWNRERRLQGHLDIGLNEAGQRQAGAVGRRLARERIDALYTSDLQRARQTAEAITRATGLAAQADDRLRERSYGVFEGHCIDDLARHFPAQHADWQARRVDAVIERGETLRAFHRRIATALDGIARRHPGQRVVLTVHGGVLDCAYRLATDTPLDTRRAWDLLNASINRIAFDGVRFVLRDWGDIGHLIDAGLDEAGHD